MSEQAFNYPPDLENFTAKREQNINNAATQTEDAGDIAGMAWHTIMMILFGFGN